MKSSQTSLHHTCHQVVSDYLASPWTIAHMLLCPWALAGVNPGVGWHFLLQGIFPTRGGTYVSYIGRWILYHWATREALRSLNKPWINPVNFLCLLSLSHEVWLGQCYFSRMRRWITATNALVCPSVCVLGFPSSWGIEKNSCWFSCFFFFWCWLVCFDLAIFQFKHKFVHRYQKEREYKLAKRLAESPDICFGFRWAKQSSSLYGAAWLNRVLDWTENQCQVSR